MASEPKRPIPAATFGRNFGRYKDQAIADGIVEISHHGRLVGAYLSKEEYNKFQILKDSHRLENYNIGK